MPTSVTSLKNLPFIYQTNMGQNPSSSSLSSSSSSSSSIDCEMSRLVLGSGGHAPLFTVAQWAEMEHQALVFKYLKAGLPVPPDLLLPIRNSFNLISPSFLRHHPALTYASFCGKKIDPEPGRCRRTDGKKWRCSKDAHPDSKYCERHMNRGRYRSRKLVESQTALQSMSTITSDMKTGSRTNSGSFQNMPSHSGVSSGCLSFGSDASQFRMEPIPYGIVTRGNRVLDGAEEHNFMSEDSGSARSLGVDSTVDSPWSLMTSRVPLNSSSQPRSGSLFLSNSSQSQTMQDIQPLTVDTAMAKQQQRQYVGGEFGVLRSIKQEQQPLQPFFDEWPKSRDLGFYPKDHRSTNNLSNPGQQPMSNATTPSNFFEER